MHTTWSGLWSRMQLDGRNPGTSPIDQCLLRIFRGLAAIGFLVYPKVSWLDRCTEHRSGERKAEGPVGTAFNSRPDR